MCNKSYTFRKSHFKPYTDCSYSRYCRRFHISVQLGGRSSRRNSLRRKLKDNLQVRRQITQNPTFETDNTDIQTNLDASEKKTGFESVKISEIVSEVDGVERDKGVGESVLWNKLEGWIDDIEFWGLGSSPIFTVHQDFKGNIKRVFVDEDEIWRRSGIPHLEFRDERELEEFGEVKSKISHARFVAQEMERGNYQLSKSSSVVKFVAYGDSSSGFVSGIRSGVMRSDFIPNVSRFGIVPLCCLLLVWTVKKFIFKGKGENELTRLEKEMLRRKMESRKKKEERCEDAIVQVVPELIMPAAEFVERPCVDKEELMNSIEEMARHSREVEKAEHSSYEQPFIEIDTVDGHLDDPNSLKSEHTANAEDTDSIVEKEPEKSVGNTVLEGMEDQLHTSLQISGTNDLSTPIGQSTISKEACRKKLRIIRSVAAAREYLSAVDEVLTAANSEECEEYGQKLKIESIVKNNWLEKNFDELLPVLEKMGDGFTKNYAVAREKVRQELDRGSDLTQLVSALNDNTELEWMDDDELREIVFKVRDNELAGRDPFHSMDDEDKVTFFKGLEEKVDKESEKLSALHEFLHSNIENLDYGADGISVYDPPEKIIPRWKGAPFDKIRDLLANTPKTQQAAPDTTAQEKIDKKLAPSKKAKPLIKVTEKPKIVIESSDGSVRPGKRTGKEQWQHTKKHSLGFLESYNAETDPEIKALMKDMGKDLDRWITEEEVKKAAKLMRKIPQRGKAFVEKKLSKLKNEVERFGTQAVLSKYKEYSVEEEEDYLWWLDLPFVLCIELYTHEGDELKVGFYTLEMAEDLELDPKPYHMIAFEEPAECKSLCYIIQSHLEMLGKDDKSFVVAQPPKDAFRDAKANGFAVTVIRKGKLLLNVDQPLEEVEELITEIGSKIYHDQIMKERSVDMRSIMKGVLSTSKPTKRKRVKRRPLRKPKN